MSPLLPPDPPARRATTLDKALVAVLAAAAAIGALAASGEATGWRPADLVWRAGFGALLVFAGAKAQRWTWLWAAAVAALASPDLLTAAPAVVGLVAAIANVSIGRRTRLVGAAVLGLAAQSLLRLELADPHGLATLVATVATLPVLWTALRNVRSRTRRVVLAVAGGLVTLGVILAVAQAFAVFQARSSVATGIDAARSGFDAARSGDEQTAVQQFEAAATAFRAANDELSAPWSVAGRAVPLLGQHARAMAEITDAGADLAEPAAGATADAPLEELRFEDGALDLARVAEFAEPLDRAAAALVAADAVVQDVDDGWLLAPLADRVDQFADEVDEARPQAEIAREGIEVAPSLFGGDGLRRYFVAFMTPAEQRGLGGFIGNFGVLTADRGDVSLVRSDEINVLQQQLRANAATMTEPEDYVARYGRFNPNELIGDAGLSPDFPSVAQVIEEVFPQSGGQPLDGVILVDPHALQALLNFTGPITVEGLDTPLTTDNAADFLLREQYVDFDSREDRKDFLEEASRRTFEALTSGDLPGPRDVSDVLGPMVDQGRLLVHSSRPEEQAFFDQVGLDGAFPAVGDGDLVAVTTQNSVHNKGDSFLTRRLDYQATVDPDSGAVEATATVTLVNEAPPGGLPDVFIAVNPAPGTPDLPDLPIGTNRMYLSLYTPHGLVTADVDGETLAVEAERELGVNVYAQFIDVPPGGTVTVTFQLAGGVDLRDGYRLAVAGQPTINPDEVTVSVGTASGELEAGEGFEARDGGLVASWSDAEDHVLTAEISR